MVTTEARTTNSELGFYQVADIMVVPRYETVVQEREGEIRMDEPWSAFGQLIFVNEMKSSTGQTIKKIAAVSMSYPAGVRSRMGEAIIRQTLQPNSPFVYEWDGVEEGKLQAVVKEQGTAGFDFGMLDRFVDVSEQIITASHACPGHEYVQEFLCLQQQRRRFLPALKKDIAEVLYTSDFLHKSAFEEQFKGKGLYRLEMYMDEDGVLLGVAPNGQVRPIAQIAADAPHAAWLAWLQEAVAKPGSRIIGHIDDTETVTSCGGSKGCSDFFSRMEKQAPGTAYKDMITMPTLGVSLDADNQYCDTCNKAAAACTCSIVN